MNFSIVNDSIERSKEALAEARLRAPGAGPVPAGGDQIRANLIACRAAPGAPLNMLQLEQNTRPYRFYMNHVWR